MGWDPEADKWDDDKYWADKSRREAAEDARRATAVERWFKSRVARLIGLHWLYRHTSAAHRAGMLDWYWQEHSRFLGWQDHDTFSGPGHPSGHFVMFDNAIKEAVGFAVRWNDPTGAVEYFLDYHLSKPRESLFLVPEEPGGYDLLRNAGLAGRANKLADAARRISRAWPRPCADCGAEYRPKRKGQRHCDSCRVVRRPPKPRTEGK